jgi:hypothetical protein
LGAPSPNKIPRRLKYYDCSTLNRFAGRFVVEILQHLEYHPADFGKQPSIVAKERTQNFGKGPDKLPMGKPKQQLFMHIF